MQIGIGLKAHSGWAALVQIGQAGKELQLIDRRRIELVDPQEVSWARQPFHAAEVLPRDEAERTARRGIQSANREAKKQMKAMIQKASKEAHQIVGCGIFIGSKMPDWTMDQIFATHIRMHKAEGALFPQALANAARECGLKVIEISEKDLDAIVSKRISASEKEKLVTIGRLAGAPWGKDQKNAAIAAILALKLL